MQGIQYPPRTIMEVFKALPEGTLAEIIEGKLYMSPSPTTTHQRVHKELLVQLQAVIEKGKRGEIWYARLEDKTINRLSAPERNIHCTRNRFRKT